MSSIRQGNEARAFTALFLTDMPSYVGLGYEIRDVHHEPVENERYTKLFVFREHGESDVYPSKARFDETYIWGENQHLFDRLTAMRLYADTILPEIRDRDTRWLIPPDAAGHRGVVAWTQTPTASDDGRLVFVANYHQDPSGYFGIPGLDSDAELHLEYSTDIEQPSPDGTLASNGFFHRIEDMAPHECRSYRIVRP